MDLPIASIVGKPSWKQVLIELVATERIDPWDVDIVKVADGFFKIVREMEKMDFHLPANIILASAILLKYKSEAIRFVEPAPVEMEGEPLIVGDEGEIAPLTLKGRLPPKVPITLNELISEMEKVIKYDDIAQRPRKGTGVALEMVDLEFNTYDIEAEMNKLYARMKEEMDGESLVLFSSLVQGKDAQGVILTLSPLLHLANEKAVMLKQDKMWGEIFIKVNGWNPGAL